MLMQGLLPPENTLLIYAWRFVVFSAAECHKFSFGDSFFDVGGGFHPFPQMDVDQAVPWSTTPRYRAKSKA
ncbi:MAG: hypothetical protein RB296_12460 [Acidobacteriota bacterium]|jgi:hypothetical protein|nr:hypothetical protein [Acidobacteriota bacterium]